MVNQALLQRIRQTLEPIVLEHDLIVEDVRWIQGKHARLIVTVDLDTEPGSVDSTRLDSVSRAVSAALDDIRELERAYTLEVSTPGAERELSDERHFLRARGRMVHFVLNDGSEFTGRINAIANTAIELVDSEVQSVELADVSSAKVLIEFKR